LDASCVSAARAVFPFVAPSALVFVGCAKGVDAAAVAAFPACEVMRVQAFAVGGRVVRSSFARRSVSVVSAVVLTGGLWCTFPSGVCPVGLVPSRSASACFGGFGSGTWSSLAFAVGCGCACLVSCSPVCAPSWLISRGVSLGGALWFIPSSLSLLSPRLVF
jgi:hypothetical protein